MAVIEDHIENKDEEVDNENEPNEEENFSIESDDSETEDLESTQNIASLQQKLVCNPYDYNTHIELITHLCSRGDLVRWREAYEKLQKLMIITPEHWLSRIETEENISSQEEMFQLFKDSTLDCYSIEIYNKWCMYIAICCEDKHVRWDELLQHIGADPLIGKTYWSARKESDIDILQNMSADDPDLSVQEQRVFQCLQEMVIRPLFNLNAWDDFEELAEKLKSDDYIQKMKEKQELAQILLQAISLYEGKLINVESTEEKYAVYKEYIDAVKVFYEDDKYIDCDCKGILKVIYERASFECLEHECVSEMLQEYASLAKDTPWYWYALELCTRRCPSKSIFWMLKMQQAQREKKDWDSIQTIFEQALPSASYTYNDSENLWLTYLEGIRRYTNFEETADVEVFRKIFRSAWDWLGENWGDEANDSEIPLFWARLEYKKIKDPIQGKELIEEILRYGTNRTKSKYWEALLQLECNRDEPPANEKIRKIFRRALKAITDYPLKVAEMWINFERDNGDIDSLTECITTCKSKEKEWRDIYESMKTKKKESISRFSNKRESAHIYKRKIEEDSFAAAEGRKKAKRSKVEGDGDINQASKTVANVNAAKNTQDDDHTTNKQGTQVKPMMSVENSGSGASKDACTIFVSNLPFKLDQQALRSKLSNFGEIVSFKVKSGVKSYGGSICYCQYSNTDEVKTAISHDRTLFDGRPMFISPYSVKAKGKASFKYAMTEEKNKLFVKNLPYTHCTQEILGEVFGKYGTVTDIRIVNFKDGKPKGLAYIEYEDEKFAANALKETGGHVVVGDRNAELTYSAPPPRSTSLQPTATLGKPRRDPSSGMRRTKLTSMIPSVLQKSSTSQINKSTTTVATASEPQASTSNQEKKQKLTNEDFRNILLKK